MSWVPAPPSRWLTDGEIHSHPFPLAAAARAQTPCWEMGFWQLNRGSPQASTPRSLHNSKPARLTDNHQQAECILKQHRVEQLVKAGLWQTCSRGDAGAAVPQPTSP